MYAFKAKIYKIGINAVADVPDTVSGKMKPEKGYIRIKGTINGFDFTTTLTPVRDGLYRLYVNIPMLKGGNAALGDEAKFSIEQNFTAKENDYPMVPELKNELKSKKLEEAFESLTPSRRKDILKYLNYLKTAETLQKNIDKVIQQLEAKSTNVRVP